MVGNLTPPIWFAVTDQYVIIPLREVKREVYEEVGILVETELMEASSKSTHCVGHHKFYFKSLWLDEDGVPAKGTVFTTRQEAVNWACKGISTEITEKRKEIRSLKQRLDALKEVK